MSSVSILKPYGYQARGECGYCKSTSGGSSYYMGCDQIRVDHYQSLMNRGWRRSGTTYYKPDLTRSCCPHYTIRIDAKEFVAKREQRRAINRWNEFVLGSEYKRKAAMLCPQSRDEKKRRRDLFDLLDAVHKTEYIKVQRPVGKKSKTPIEPAHKFEVTLESDAFSREKYDVFLKYQLEIHKDPASRWKTSDFKRFLCSGLDRSTLKTDGVTQKLGSYHQCYRLDGKVVAVGVLDLMPQAVSSVYLFYDPAQKDWDWGKISAVRELALTIEGGYRYYHMGYYIHSCRKMRYKAEFTPCYLLDPVNNQYNLFDQSYRENLEKRSFYSPSLHKDNPSSDQKSANITQTHQDTASSTSTTKERGQMFDNTQDLEFDEADPEIDDLEIPQGSLFDYNVPGIMTKDEVAKLDLDHWKLMVRTSLVDFEDLVGWEEGKIDNPDSIKGIAAELIAATGPELLENSAVKLF